MILGKVTILLALMNRYQRPHYQIYSNQFLIEQTKCEENIQKDYQTQREKRRRGGLKTI